MFLSTELKPRPTPRRSLTRDFIQNNPLPRFQKDDFEHGSTSGSSGYRSASRKGSHLSLYLFRMSFVHGWLKVHVEAQHLDINLDF